MNIFKRPIFYAVLVCAAASVLTLFSIKPYTLIFVSVIAFLFVVFKYRNFKYITVIIAILVFTISLTAECAKIDKIKSIDSSKVKGEFLVISEPIFYDDFNQITLKESKCSSLPNGIKIVVYDTEKLNVNTGDIVYAELKIDSIKSEDKYNFYNYGNGVYTKGTINDLQKLDKQNNFYKFFGNIRSYISKTTAENFQGDSAGLSLAITTGDKSLLSDNFLMNVKATGISHVIVVSGLHLSIIMSAVFMLLDRMLYSRYLRTFLAVLFVLIISSICGNTMSVLRAGSMFIIGAFAPVFNRDKDLLSSLLTGVVAVLIFTPFAILNISFLLSVLATLSVIWISPFYSDLLIKRLKIKSKISTSLVQAVIVSFFAMIFTLPITVNTFGYVSVVAPITNIFVTYFVTFALVFNCIGLLLSPIPYIGYIGVALSWVADLICEIIVAIVNLVAKLPVTVAILPKIFIFLSVALIILVIAYMYYYDYYSKNKEG